jgi:hypothetical protein
MPLAATSKIVKIEHLAALEPAIPFLIAIIVLLLSAVLVEEITERLTKHFEEGWNEEELLNVLPDRSPKTHAQTASWIVDIAQIPAVIAPSAAGLIISYHAFESIFLTIYTVVFALGILAFCYYLRQVDILKYRTRGPKLLKYRLSPLVVGGTVLNLFGAIGAVIAAK